MIKLEDLKIGDKIYGVCSDGLLVYQESIVQRELLLLDAVPKFQEVVICKGGIEFITRNYEEHLFRTLEEAERKLKEIRLKLAEDLIKSGKLMDRLFECATSSKRLNKYTEVPIYKLAIEMINK